VTAVDRPVTYPYVIYMFLEHGTLNVDRCEGRGPEVETLWVPLGGG